MAHVDPHSVVTECAGRVPVSCVKSGGSQPERSETACVTFLNVKLLSPDRVLVLQNVFEELFFERWTR